MKIAARRMRKDSILPGYRGKEVVLRCGEGAARPCTAAWRAPGKRSSLPPLDSCASSPVQWEQREGDSRLPVGFLIGMEGADPDPDAGAGRGVVGMMGCAWSA